MKKSLIILAAFALAICFAMSTFAAPGAVGSPDTVDGSLGNVDSATLMADALGQSPESTITAKELMSVTARLHSALNGTSLSAEYNLDTYYAYAVNNGIFADGVYTSEEQIPTRAQVVMALYNVVKA